MWRLLFLITLSTSAFAQPQQGYTNERPNIVVDRSVLEDLKGYEPPPMFGDDESSSQPTVKTIAPLPLSSPQLTAPKAETLLNHPVQNFRVLTERNSTTTNPPQTKIISPAPKPKKIEKKLPETKNKKELKKEVAKETKKKEIVELAKEPTQSPPPSISAYKPKANPTMPAVPPIHVESSTLPALPMPTPKAENISKPSIGERIIDQALERKIETDKNKITEKLTADKNPKVKENKKAVLKTANNSLEFKVGQMDLTDKIESQIRKFILPEITNDLNARIQILSFATSPDNSESTARRISLARALSVRDYLKKMNIDVSRIDVRALASDNSTPPDRVDIVLLK